MSSANPQANPQADPAIHTPYGKDHPTALSTSKVERELVHQRRITLNGYVRNDGLFGSTINLLTFENLAST